MEVRLMTRSSISCLSAAVVLACALGAGAATAQPNNPIGLWNIVAHDDTNPGMLIVGAQRICFLANGTWFSPTFPGWAGVWFQKGTAGVPGLGNRVRLLGNWQPGAPFSDSAELDFIHLTMMTGSWTEWQFAGYPPPAFPPPPPPGPPFSFLRVSVCRLGGCAGPPPPAGGGAPPLSLFGAAVGACNP